MRAIATRHWLFLILFGIGLALRVIAQIAYRPALLFIDSYRYLDLLDTLDPTRSQTLGYDFLVLWPLLKVGNLFLVTLVQHLLGLAMGVAIYGLCLRYRVSRGLAAGRGCTDPARRLPAADRAEHHVGDDLRGVAGRRDARAPVAPAPEHPPRW